METHLNKNWMREGLRLYSKGFRLNKLNETTKAPLLIESYLNEGQETSLLKKELRNEKDKVSSSIHGALSIYQLYRPFPLVVISRCSCSILSPLLKESEDPTRI